MRIGFITGSPSRLRRYALTLKHRKMQLEGVVYPDVYSLPYFLTDQFEFIRDGSAIARDRFDLILSELNRDERQLDHLASLAESNLPLAIIPGPPDLLASVLTERKLKLVRTILARAKYVWAYADRIRSFCDGLIGDERAQLIPWPFDRIATRRLGSADTRSDDGKCRILLHVPIRFAGIGQSYPFVLKAILLDVLDELPPEQRRRVTFHTFAYTQQDRDDFRETGYRDGMLIQLQRKRGFADFVRFVGGCRAVINLTTGNILGRVTFIAAALARPGIFSDNVELNHALYPRSTVSSLDAERLREKVRQLLFALSGDGSVAPFLPAEPAVAEIGDFPANAWKLRQLLREGRR